MTTAGASSPRPDFFMQLTLAFWNLQQLKSTNRADASKHVANFAAHHDAAFVIEQRTDGGRIQEDMLPEIHQTAERQYGARIQSGVLDAGKGGAAGQSLFCFVRSKKPSAENSSYEVYLQKLSSQNEGPGGSVIATLGVWDKSTSRVREVKLAIPASAVPANMAEVEAALAKQHITVADFETDSNGQSVLTVNL